jgi:UDP-N-acetyl-D-glucosamine dehydrogenase
MNHAAQQLHDRFTGRGATICVIGQGYVGLPLALEFVEAGFRCIGLDTDQARVDELRRGISYITDVAPERLEQALATGRFAATADYAQVARADAVCICVPTPLNKTRQPDLSYIQAALDELCEHVQEPCLVVLESTTFPGTTEEVVAPRLFGRDGADGDGADGDGAENGRPRSRLRSRSRSRSRDGGLFVAFSPERVDPGNAEYGIGNTPKVVGGVDEASTALVTALYEQIIDQVHPVNSTTEAEMVKLLENTFRAVNIALVNEMAIMCDRMDIDIWEVIEAASTKPFGFMPFYPGPGIGGHCIPLDPSYLSWKAKTYGFHNRFIELATDVNTNMPRFVVDKLVRLLNEQGKAVKGAKVLLLGMAYKANVHDTRESPAIDIWRLLEGWGADLAYYDPYVEFVEELGGVRSVELTAEVVGGADAVVVVCDHDGTDYAMIAELASLVLDTRNVLMQAPSHVRKL